MKVADEIGGTVAAGWEGVAEAFASNFAEHDEIGASCCVYHHGTRVVDIWGGWADDAAGRRWGEDTLSLVFSSTKGVTAICANILVERGLLELDAPVASYWPEFAANGKDDIPVRWLLSHRAGLAHVEGTFTMDDVLAWEPVVAALAAEAPQWPPGTAHGYHMRSYGWLVGEVVRRVTGRSLGRFLADEIAQPLGVDFFVGLPESHEHRVARLYPAPPLTGASAELFEAYTTGDTLTARVFSGPSGLFAYDDRWNTRPFHAAEMPSSNGVGDARALARIYAACVGEVDGLRLLQPDTVAAAREVQSDGNDVVLLFPTRFGLGFALPPMMPASCGPSSFGHPGAGGSLGFGDLEFQLGFGYVMNQMKLGLTGDERANGLVAAAYSAAAALALD